MNYPIEVCCPHCGEVLILVEAPILPHTRLSKVLNYLDTPMRASNRVSACPLCEKQLPGWGWISAIKKALNRTR